MSDIDTDRGAQHAANAIARAAASTAIAQGSTERPKVTVSHEVYDDLHVGGKVITLTASSGRIYPAGSHGEVVGIFSIPKIHRTLVMVKLGEGSHDVFAFDDWDVTPERV
jgi:hypothetical protein